MQAGGSTSASSTWCGNLQHAHQAALQSAQWICSCLPCVKGHHKVHPSSIELCDGSILTIDAKKRLRVLHVVPDPKNLICLAKPYAHDSTDAGDRCSIDSSCDDYRFMRWNRPIHSNLQRNLCNCSFRKSQRQPVSVLKDKNSGEVNDHYISNPVKEERTTLQPLKENGGLCSLQTLAEKLSQNILSEAVQKSLEIKSATKHTLPEQRKDDNPAKVCDIISVDDINVTVSRSIFDIGGYINPVFSSSNDALDLVPICKKLDDDARCQKAVLKERQDFNANEHVEDNNSSNKLSSVKKSVSARINLCADQEQHRKSCRAGGKAHLKKPLLLLIHGAGSSSEIWRNLITHLVGEGYECVAPDLLGHGLSSAPDQASYYTFHALLQDLLCVFDRHVTDNRTAVVLGHGYGCSLAAAIARYRAEQVIQLVLISGGGPAPLAPRTPPSVSPCLRACLQPLLMCGFKRDVVYSVCGKQMEPITSELSAVPRHIVEHIAQGHIWPEGDAAFHRRIVAPTLLVHGMKDQHVTLVQQCEMERTIPRSFLEVIPEAGHYAMLETPSHLSHMILCFIDWWSPN